MTSPSEAARRRGRERIGADAARVWARELVLGNPYAKAILLALANYMNEDGAAWPGTTTIARDTDISEETVVKRLRWLEQIGAIAIFKRWRDENGRVNYEARGKATSSEIRFLVDADIDVIEGNAREQSADRPLRGKAKADHEERMASSRPQREQSEEFSSRPGRELNPTGPQVAPEQPPPASNGHIDSLEREQEDSPQTPLRGAFADRLDEFARAYEHPISDYPKTEAVWQALTDAERSDAITGARGYAALRRKQTKRAVEDTHRWLRGRKWLGYLLQGQRAEVAAQRSDVVEGSEEWTAWEVYYRCCGKAGIDERCIRTLDGKRVALVPRQWPPVGAGIDASVKWLRFQAGEPQFAAWVRRLRELPDGPFMPRTMPDANGRFVQTITVPCEWPPPKSATTTGPPSAPLVTADDEQALAGE